METVESQVEETQEETQETAENQEPEAIEQVGELLRKDVEPQAEAQEETQEEKPQEEEESPKENQEEVQAQEETQAKEEPQEPIIDDSIIEQYPTLRMYRGKPLKEIVKSYDSVVRKFTKNSQELAELKKQKEKESLPDISSMPDPVEKPEEAKKWLQERDSKIRSQVEPPQPQVDYRMEVAKNLPQGTDVQKVINEWANDNSEILFNELGQLRPEIQTFYNNNPNVLISNIVKHYKTVSKLNQTQTQTKNEAYKVAKKAIKNAEKNKENAPQAQVNATQRTVEYTPEEQLLINIGELIPKEDS